MVQTRLGYLRHTRNQNPEFLTSSLQELDFSNILPQELEYSTSCKKYLELFSILSRSWLQDVENSISYSSLSEAHPCKLTFSFPVVCALNTSDICSYFEKGCRKKCACTRQSRKVVWDMSNTLFLTL